MKASNHIKSQGEKMVSVLKEVKFLIIFVVEYQNIDKSETKEWGDGKEAQDEHTLSIYRLRKTCCRNVKE